MEFIALYTFYFLSTSLEVDFTLQLMIEGWKAIFLKIWNQFLASMATLIRLAIAWT